MNADGTHEQIFEQVTSAQLETEIKARMALIESTRADPKHAQNIIAIDSACVGADLWLFDAINLGGNQLCGAARVEVGCPSIAALDGSYVDVSSGSQ